MVTGDKVFANKLFLVCANNTFKKLVNTEDKSIKKYLDLCNRIGPSTGFIYCFVNLDGSPKDLELRDSNLWIYPDKDYDKLLEEFEKDMLNNPMPLFIVACAKDSTWDYRYPNKSSAILLTMVINHV